MNSEFCVNCGIRFPIDAKFCGKCGSPAYSDKSQISPEPIPEPKDAPKKEPEPKDAPTLPSADVKFDGKGFAGAWACIFFIIGGAAYFIPLTNQGWTFANISEICKGPLGMYGPILQGHFGDAYQACSNASFWMPIVNFLLIIGIIFTIYWAYKKVN